MQVFVWKIPSMYGGFAVGYTRERYICVMAKTEEEAVKIIKEQIGTDLPFNILEAINKVIMQVPLMAYNEGDVFWLPV